MGTRGWSNFKTAENSDTFSWVYKSSTANGSRIATTHKNKWSLWASKVKTIAAAIMTGKRVIATEERDKGQGTADQKECDAMYAHRTEGLLGLLEGPIY
jgi:hypothetical protein